MSRVAAVIGVGPGIGAAAAKRFAKEGYAVALVARRKDRLDAIKAEIEAEVKGGKVISIPTDSTDAAQVAAAFKTIKDTLGDPDVLVYNASSWSMKPFLELKPDDFANVWKASAVLSSQQVLPNMVKNKKGTILITGATASLRGGANFSAFASAKFALRALAQSLAREFGPQGIHVSHVIIDGRVDIEYTKNPAYINPDAVADTYWHLHLQNSTAWTQELDIRPNVEKF